MITYSIQSTLVRHDSLSRLLQVCAAIFLAVVLLAVYGAAGAFAAGPDPDGEPAPVIQPGALVEGRSQVRATETGAIVTCGPHYWFDVAGDTNIVDTLLVRLLRADGSFFAERHTYVGFIGELGDPSNFMNWDPDTYELVYCVDAVHVTPGDGTKDYCVNDEPIATIGDEWELSWFMANYPPLIYSLQTWDLLDCGANDLFCQARVQQAARQLAVWRLIHGFEPDPDNPTNGNDAVDLAVLAVYQALLDSIPAEPPLFYTDDPLQLSIEPASADNILPGGESHTVQVQLTVGGAAPTPLPGYTVALNSTLGQVEPAQAQTDDDGVATFTITSNSGGTADLTATAVVTVPQPIRYDVSPPSSDQAQGMAEGVPVTVTATATKTWIQTSPGISLQKTVADPPDGIVSVGQEVTFTVSVRNTGDTVLVTVPITDLYEAQYLRYVRTSLSDPDVNIVDIDTQEGTLAWDDITDDLGDIGVGQEVTFTVTFEALEATDSTENFAFADNVIDEHGNPVPPVGGQDSVNVGIKEPTAILLLWLNAKRTRDGVEVGWRTGWEQNTWGFHLWRSESGQRSDAQRITPTLILARGSGSVGALYQFLDTSAEPGIHYSYWLEEIELDGKRHEYGPVRVGAGGITAPVYGWNSMYLPAVTGAQ